jgi:hypothetical protein
MNPKLQPSAAGIKRSMGSARNAGPGTAKTPAGYALRQAISGEPGGARRGSNEIEDQRVIAKEKSAKQFGAKRKNIGATH